MKYLKLFEQISFSKRVVNEEPERMSMSFYRKGDFVIKLDDGDKEDIGEAHYRIEDNVMHLIWINIRDYHKKQGYGKALMNKLVEICKENNYEAIKLVVLFYNINAIRFYKSLGFKVIDAEARHYIMRLDINHS